MLLIDTTSLLDSELFRLVIFPTLIFLARIIDVSLGTLRMVFIARGTKSWASVLGFFEVLIWLIAVSYILKNLTSPIAYIAFAGGFAMGNYVGLRLEEKMALGLLGITIITNNDAKRLVAHLRELKYGTTVVSALGATGRVRIVYSVIRRKDLDSLRRAVEQFHPNAFIAVQAVKSVSKDVYPYPEFVGRTFDPLRRWRKGK